MYIYLILFIKTVIKSCGFGPTDIKDFFNVIAYVEFIMWCKQLCSEATF